MLHLHRGGPTRLNPLDSGPWAAWANPEELIGHRTALVCALIAAVLRRDLLPVEHAAVGWAVAQVSGRRDPTPTLVDVARLLDQPRRRWPSGPVPTRGI